MQLRRKYHSYRTPVQHFVIAKQDACAFPVLAAAIAAHILTGDSENENTADLQLSVSLVPGQVVAGIEGTVTVSRGLASSLDQVLGQILNTESGILTSADDGYDRQIESVQKSIDRQKTVFDLQEASIRKQFQALESAISQLNATSSYLGGQLSSLPQISNA